MLILTERGHLTPQLWRPTEISGPAEQLLSIWPIFQGRPKFLITIVKPMLERPIWNLAIVRARRPLL